VPALFNVARKLGDRKWFGAVGRLYAPLDRLIGKVTKGRLVGLGGRKVTSLLITTTGRKSGKPRANPLLYAPDGDGFVVIGSNWGQTHHPAWSANLLANPTATVAVGGREIPVRATLATGEERERLWQLLLRTWPAYQSYEATAGGRDLRIFRLEPVR
jgi:deazaflavin-dependent oxidoreductase (nitroreductase family)